MESLLQDTRYALRSLRQHPAFAAAVVLSLGLAIGAVTIIFSFVNAILVQPLPFADADHLIRLRELRLEPGEEPMEVAVNPRTFAAWQERPGPFTDLAAESQRTLNLTGGGEPEFLVGSTVTTNYFSVLGVKPILGRDFQPDEGRLGQIANVVMLSHGLWQRRFGADPEVIGSTVNLDQVPHTVIGVLPPGFKFPNGVELWLPMAVDPLDPVNSQRWFLNAFGRLRPGEPLAQARREMTALAEQLAAEQPEAHEGWSVVLRTVPEDLRQDLRGGLLALFAAAAFVLLIACANAANLLLARSLDQAREVELRLALGASRRRIAQQFLVQSLILGLLAGALGLALTWLGLGPLARLSPLQDLGGSFQHTVRVDPTVLAFSLLVSLAAGVGFGLSPALSAARSGGQGSVAGDNRTTTALSGQRWLNAFMVCEVALSVVLLTGAGLMLQSFRHEQHRDLGFRAPGLLTLQLALPASRYPEVQQKIAFFEQLVERVKTLPGVISAGVGSAHPFSAERSLAPLVTEDHPQENPNDYFYANHRGVDAGYLPTLGVPLIKGRMFTEADRTGQPNVAIVSKRFAESQWPGQDPVGKRVRLARDRAPWVTVVGEVGDVYETSDPDLTWYVPDSPNWRFRSMHLLLRTQGDPLALADQVRQTVWQLDPEQPVYNVQTMEQATAEYQRPERFAALLYGAFGILGLVLATLGIYGVTAYTVGQRRQEFGIRIALGADWQRLLRLVLGRTVRLVGLGLALGLGAALALGRLITSLLHGASPADPLVLLGVAGVLMAIAILASLPPARKAMKVDPVVALRHS